MEIRNLKILTKVSLRHDMEAIKISVGISTGTKTYI